MRLSFGTAMPDNRLLPHLCASAKDARANTPGASQQRVASYADISTSTLQRFEGVPASWMDDTDEIVQAYAHYTHREPVDIWTDALERMKRASGPSSGGGPAGPVPG